MIKTRSCRGQAWPFPIVPDNTQLFGYLRVFAFLVGFYVGFYSQPSWQFGLGQQYQHWMSMCVCMCVCVCVRARGHALYFMIPRKEGPILINNLVPYISTINSLVSNTGLTVKDSFRLTHLLHMKSCISRPTQTLHLWMRYWSIMTSLLPLWSFWLGSFAFVSIKWQPLAQQIGH
eukprot:scaffold64158_cov21-Tisochrysis_lutea.AAC.1